MRIETMRKPTTYKDIMDRHPCRYDGKPCDNYLLCHGCERMNLDGLPHSKDPVKFIIWEDNFEEGGAGYPRCPECHELVYGMSKADENGIGQCPFCGQHCRYNEEGAEKAKPGPQEIHICPHCGDETLVGRRAKSNGHFHGRCRKCGCTVVE